MKHIRITFLFLLCAIAVLAQQRGFKPVNINIDGRETLLYGQSHALLIGNSNYTDGWATLPGIVNEVKDVKTALEKSGFHVIVIQDLARSQMDEVISDFIKVYGKEKDNRLLIYFAGHGCTIHPKSSKKEEDNMGYLVPIYAPKPSGEQDVYKTRVLGMVDMEKYALHTASKHVLFLFDACLSGSVFAMEKAVAAGIDSNTGMPVRQIIIAGSADETRPDKSIFCQQFITALTTSEADANKDGYLTGSELGEYLQTTVAANSGNSQHPQYGKIRNPKLDKGDFVFVLPTTKPIAGEKTATTKKSPHAESHQSDMENEWTDEFIMTYGTLRITSEIDGDLYIDNAFIKKISANNNISLNIETGEHNLEIRGNKPFAQTIQIDNDRTVLVNAKFADKAAEEVVDEYRSCNNSYWRRLYNVVDEMPFYPGGDFKRYLFLAANMVYPEQATKDHIEGTVLVSFIIDTFGNVTHVKVLCGIGGGCDEEAVRVVKMMPRWHPGKQNGNLVNVQLNMPITFRLPK